MLLKICRQRADQCAAVMPQPCLIMISPFGIKPNIHSCKYKPAKWEKERENDSSYNRNIYLSSKLSPLTANFAAKLIQDERTDPRGMGKP